MNHSEKTLTNHDVPARSLLGLLDHVLLLVVQEDEGEHEDARHHAEGGGVVGVGLPDEALVLVVAEGDH